MYNYQGTLDRIAVGTMMLSCFIIGTVYKSNLMAMLITPRIVRPFDSLPELLETDLNFIVSEGSYLHYAFKVCIHSLNNISNLEFFSSRYRIIDIAEFLNSKLAIIDHLFFCS